MAQSQQFNNVIDLDIEDMYNFLYLLANDVRHDFTSQRILSKASWANKWLNASYKKFFYNIQTPLTSIYGGSASPIKMPLENKPILENVDRYNGSAKLFETDEVNTSIDSKEKVNNINLSKGDVEVIIKNLFLFTQNKYIKDNFYELVVYILGFISEDVNIYEAFNYVKLEMLESINSIDKEFNMIR